MSGNESAFPYQGDAFKNAELGLTIRQYYKAAALQGALGNPNLSDIKAAKWMATYAAEVADAMLAEDEWHAKKG
jgi:hypothetical protein